jgi:hypothetical protein
VRPFSGPLTMKISAMSSSPTQGRKDIINVIFI